ncbi:MAG: hypothetical protein M1837_004211 [Sclerophora amabilis]|nr:MAG: hypothetical protein M1837_004211 [Sclerophora amabilis]
MNCKITALDANGQPIAGANITLDESYSVTPLNGTVQLLTVRPERSTLTVYHPDYVRETVHFSGTITGGEWDNALLEVQPEIRVDEATLTIRLGRCILAPTSEISGEDMIALAQKKGDVRGVVVGRLDRDPKRKAYREHKHNSKPVEVAAPILIPENYPPEEAAGWRRFETRPPAVPNDSKSTKPLVEVVDEGRFLWLMYPHKPSGPQYAVLVWSPNLPLKDPPPTLDMILFYPPTTEQDSYSVPYPFGVQMFTPKDPDQPYMSLGIKYLGEENGFYYQLIAQRRSAVLIMPICNYGDYGPFTRGEGVLRLCREVSLLLHRERRTTKLSLPSTLGGLDPAYTLAGASLRDFPFLLYSSASSAPPQVGSIALSFYSNSARPVKSLMPSSSYPIKDSRFPKPLFGCPDPEQIWRSTWRELWDMDGFHPGTGTWLAYLPLLATWFSAHPARIIRLCHSSGRSPRDVDSDPHPLFKTLRSTLNFTRKVPSTRDSKKLARNVPSASEWHGERWSVVRFDNGYVSHLPPGKEGPKKVGWQVPVLVPPWADAHQATPRVAFSHFLAMSELGKTK